MTLEQMERNTRRRQRQRAEEAKAKHPAKYTGPLGDRLVAYVERYAPPGGRVLDPFAGTGLLLDRLGDLGYDARGIELEPEWSISKRVLRGDALALPYDDDFFDVIMTSPTYGNRLADKDMRPSVAGTYAKGLGRLASPGSSCHLQWGPAYREFHEAFLVESIRVLRRETSVGSGTFLLNVKDHYRGRALQGVPEWYWTTMKKLGLRRRAVVFVATPGTRYGKNSELRTDGEFIGVFQKIR